jgi:hypothetical protein
MTTQVVYLSKSDLLSLLNLLARRRTGENVSATIFKNHDEHPFFPAGIEKVAITVVEDDTYYLGPDAAPRLNAVPPDNAA